MFVDWSTARLRGAHPRYSTHTLKSTCFICVCFCWFCSGQRAGISSGLRAALFVLRKGVLADSSTNIQSPGRSPPGSSTSERRLVEQWTGPRPSFGRERCACALDTRLPPTKNSRANRRGRVRLGAGVRRVRTCVYSVCVVT